MACVEMNDEPRSISVLSVCHRLLDLTKQASRGPCQRLLLAFCSESDIMYVSSTLVWTLPLVFVRLGSDHLSRLLQLPGGITRLALMITSDPNPFWVFRASALMYISFSLCVGKHIYSLFLFTGCSEHQPLCT